MSFGIAYTWCDDRFGVGVHLNFHGGKGFGVHVLVGSLAISFGWYFHG